jgi:hypothetical protein
MARRPASILYEISKRLPFLNVKYFGLREDAHPRHPLMLAYQHCFRILRFKFYECKSSIPEALYLVLLQKFGCVVANAKMESASRSIPGEA